MKNFTKLLLLPLILISTKSFAADGWTTSTGEFSAIEISQVLSGPNNYAAAYVIGYGYCDRKIKADNLQWHLSRKMDHVQVISVSYDPRSDTTSNKWLCTSTN